MVDEAAMADVIDEFCSTVAGEFSAEDILRALAEAATRVLGVDGAGVMTPDAPDGELLRFLFATSGLSRDLERLQEQLQDGPCTAAVGMGVVINIADLAEEGDWPAYQRGALEMGLHAVCTIPLQARGRTWGVLDIYREEPRRLDASELAAAQRLANLATSYLVVTYDRDTAREMQDELTHRAMHDPLTGLPVRWVFIEQLTHSLARLFRNDSSLAVLFLDLDGLKYVNDTYGHLQGDRLLQECVRRIRAALRPTDILARIGGDEFVVMLEDLTGQSDAERVAQRVLDELSQPFRPDGETLHPSASIGVALSSDAADTADVLIAHADSAMYAAKSAGRRCYRMFDADDYAATRALDADREELVTALRQGLSDGEFEVHYQPIIDLSDDAAGQRPAWAVEALLRWNHPRRGRLTAGAFIETAERSAVMGDLGAWVLRTACQQLADWDATLGQDAPQRVFVNISPAEFGPRLVEEVVKALAASGIEARRLTLEVTESGLFRDLSGALTTARTLVELGCELAIDDFGTGYSSLSRLVEIPARTLKVDQSFTHALGRRAEASAVVSSVLLLGHSLRRTVVVEGVEDAATLEQLRELGCTHVQGYHLAMPAPAVAWG